MIDRDDEKLRQMIFRPSRRQLLSGMTSLGILAGTNVRQTFAQGGPKRIQIEGGDFAPLPIAQGERVELVFENKTPMPHPMHLHGHEFQVVEINGQRFSGAVRDTIQVPPVTRVVVAFDANNPGWWAMHCHLLYHMDAGMFTTLRYV